MPSALNISKEVNFNSLLLIWTVSCCDSNAILYYCYSRLQFQQTDVIPVIAVYVYYVVNDESIAIRLSANDSSISIDVQTGVSYEFSVYGENALGNGSVTIFSK